MSDREKAENFNAAQNANPSKSRQEGGGERDLLTCQDEGEEIF